MDGERLIKNNTPKISIIVPVYNVEKYLHRCIDSILAQTYTDFELLLIDDGSKDCSGKICDEYAIRETRIKVFHKENGGVSSARNVGLENTNGEWITFCDSDDDLKNTFLEDFISQDLSSDLLSQGYLEDRNGRIIKRCFSDQILTNAKCYPFILDMYKTTQLGFLWCKAFRKEIIAKNHIVFNINIRHMEDLDFIIKYCLCVNKISNVSKCNYIYKFPIRVKDYKEDSYPLYLEQYYNLRKLDPKSFYKDDLRFIFLKMLTISLLFDFGFRTYKQHLTYVKSYDKIFHGYKLRDKNMPKAVLSFWNLSHNKSVIYKFLLSVSFFFIYMIKCKKHDK